MANNCLNTLMKLDGSYLDGIFDLYIEDKVPADKFGSYLDGNFNFGKVIPEPDLIKIAMFLSEYRISKLDLPESTLLELINLVDNNDWYEWRKENWGTKQIALEVCVNPMDVTFETLWTPPIKVIAELSKLVKTSLRLIYVEEGAGICGEATFINGETVHTAYEDFDEVPDELRKELDLPESRYCDEDEQYEDEEFDNK